MDLFECYAEHVHEDIKPADTPNSEELFTLEGEDSPEDIKPESTEDFGELTKAVAELRTMVEALTKKKEEGGGE